MLKPSGYDEVQASGSFTPVELGGHYAVIKQVTEMQSSTGKPMIVVLFDFDKTDKQPEYHSKAFQASDKPDRKWPFNGSKYVMINDFTDSSKTSRAFKTFCTSFEKSNNCSVQWGGNDWGKQFKNKKIGVVYGEEENEYDGQTFMRRVPKWFCSWDSVASAKVPEPKYLANRRPAADPAPQSADAFINVPDDAGDDIPF